MQTVHPHIRGAYPAREFCSILRPGSSPHTWGILVRARDLETLERFIPTYVGHTAFMASLNRLYCGSSPPTWGIRASGLTDTTPSRFIPTYVGHTSSNRDAEITITVHPHLRGAYRQPKCHNASCLGSSPPTWGIRPRKHPAAVPVRFIPTYVGHTTQDSPARVATPVHPHLRGAYGRRPVGAERRPVHPHLRGAYGPRGAAAATGRRFISTYVGHTSV